MDKNPFRKQPKGREKENNRDEKVGREERREGKISMHSRKRRRQLFIEKTEARIALITPNQTEKTFIQPIHHTRLFISHKVVFITQDNQNLISI